MAAGAHFGCPKFTFDRISGHFRSIRNFNLFGNLTKWLPSAILDVRNSLPILFLAILDQYGIFIFLLIFDKMADGSHFVKISKKLKLCINLKWPEMRSKVNFGHPTFWMSEIHLRSHFWPS